MCSYTYSWYYCNHDYYIWADSIETCPNRLLSGYSADAWSIDMCKNMQVSCAGFSGVHRNGQRHIVCSYVLRSSPVVGVFCGDYPRGCASPASRVDSEGECVAE